MARTRKKVFRKYQLVASVRQDGATLYGDQVWTLPQPILEARITGVRKN